jgi:hypothetical protein
MLMDFIAKWLTKQEHSQPISYFYGLCITLGIIKLASMSMGALAFMYRHTLKR